LTTIGANLKRISGNKVLFEHCITYADRVLRIEGLIPPSPEKLDQMLSLKETFIQKHSKSFVDWKNKKEFPKPIQDDLKISLVALIRQMYVFASILICFT
jgi:hypothetical protein